jgi:hypothetical protein
MTRSSSHIIIIALVRHNIDNLKYIRKTVAVAEVARNLEYAIKHVQACHLGTCIMHPANPLKMRRKLNTQVSVLTKMNKTEHYSLCPDNEPPRLTIPGCFGSLTVLLS